MSEKRSEEQLRGDRSLFGVRMMLMDGVYWTVPPMPLHGPEYPWFKAKCKAMEHVVGLVQDAVRDHGKAVLKAAKDAGDDGEPDETEADKVLDAASKLDDEFIAIGLDLAFASFKLNYPDLDRERDFAGLITTQHLLPIWQIVNGQKQTQDLFPDDGSDPPIA
jgi:hypothetical protein